MDLMEKLVLENKMTVLHGTAMEKEDEVQNVNDEFEDLSNR